MTFSEGWRLEGAIEQKNAEQLSGWIAVLPGEETPLRLEVVVDGLSAASRRLSSGLT